MAGKTLTEHLDGLKATRASLVTKNAELLQKSMDENRSLNDAEAQESDDNDEQIAKLDADIARVSKQLARAAAEAKPVIEQAKAVSEAPARTGVDFATVKTVEKLEPGIRFARYARCQHVAKTEHVPASQVAKHLYPHDETLHGVFVQKAAVPAASTMSTTWASNLILDSGAAFADFVGYLTPRSVLGQVSDRLRRLPFDTPVVIQTAGGTAGWTKEGHAKPVTQWTYTQARMEPLKVAAIAVATQELLNRATPQTDSLFRDELARAVNRAIDSKFISADAAVADTSPAGLLNGVAALTLTGDGTISGIRCDIAAMLNALVGNNLSLSGAFWIMSEQLAVNLGLIANEVGATAFPGISSTGGTLAGLPVFTSEYMAETTDGSPVILVKGDEVFLGDEGGIIVKTSDQASIQMDNAPTNDSVTSPTATSLVSLWQTNSVGFLVERFLNWQKRRPEAVVWGYVNWSACSP